MRSMQEPPVSTVLLAAGYGTRLYPLTNDRPKALLPLGRRVIVDPILDGLEAIPDRGKVVMVTNKRFFPQVDAWARAQRLPIELVNDGTETNETRLGAINDLRLALDTIDPADDALVIGTDNLFTWSLPEFVRAARAKRPAASVAVREVATDDEARRCGVAELAADGRIVRCVEKPQQPPSRTILLAVYFFPAPVRRRVQEFLDSGGNGDAPGFFIEWLARSGQEPVYGYPTGGDWFDIGTPETYRQAEQQWLSQPAARGGSSGR